MTRARDTADTQDNAGGAVAPFVAGKNKIINGDFFVNQRAFTSTTTDGTFGFDRWKFVTFDGTCTYSTQAFSPGTAPVTGYEGTNYARIVTSGQTLSSAETSLRQSIEGVRTVTGTTTISFFAQAGSGTPKIALEFQQDFGSGGSATVNTYVGSVTLSTSWTRYSVTFSVPSISGKTIGTSNTGVLALWLSAGSTNNTRTGSLGIQSNTFNIWGVQVEAGSVATAFQTATGTLQGELAACQRYYVRLGGAALYEAVASGVFESATAAVTLFQCPVTLRAAATSVEYSTIYVYDYGAVRTISNVTINNSGKNIVNLMATVTGGTQYRPFRIETNNSLNGYLAVSAEL